jgi:gamma-glutamyltranspeptidase
VVGGVSLPSTASVNRFLLPDVTPGARVPNSLGPLVALRRGRPVLAIGAVGTGFMPETVRLTSELLSGHADLPTAMTAPPVMPDFNVRPPPFWSWPEPVPAGAYDKAMLQALAASGLPTEEKPQAQVLNLRGEAVAVTIDRRTASAARSRSRSSTASRRPPRRALDTSIFPEI